MQLGNELLTPPDGSRLGSEQNPVGIAASPTIAIAKASAVVALEAALRANVTALPVKAQVRGRRVVGAIRITASVVPPRLEHIAKRCGNAQGVAPGMDPHADIL